ncbi:MAG: aldehyde dehydrogenase [Pseudonocardiales bacterium]|nr:aldehyde dehydrogenase [Pseudonocardiales bacterium]
MITEIREQFRATVGGEDFAVSASFPVLNPATASLVAHAPAVAADDLDAVFAAAHDAYLAWRLDEKFRRHSLRRAAAVLEAATTELAPVLTAEQGKPLRDAAQEIQFTAVWLRYYADLDVPREIVQDDEAGFAEVLRRPLGVVAAITPWNFPITLAMWKIAPALRAGNTIVVKPSPYTPLTTLAVGRLLRDVLPPGVLNVVAGPDPLGAAITAHPAPRKISFTGSTRTGKKVAQAAAGNLKRMTLELGGNDPAIVLGDVDVAAIAPALFWSAFANAGQICLAVKRVYAHASIHDELVDALAAIARSVRVGDGADPATQMGPLNNRAQLEIVDGLVHDALAHGANAVAGGRALPGPGYFFEPTVISGIEDGARLVDEEQFGPALPVVRFRDEADAIARADAGDYGLTASIWSSDVEHAASLAGQLETGQVSINAHGSGVLPNLPFAGRKWSGFGVENGVWGLHEYMATQVISTPARGAR